MGNTINVKGSYIDIHDNEHVHLTVDGAKVTLEESKSTGIKDCFVNEKKSHERNFEKWVLCKERKSEILDYLRAHITGHKGKKVALVMTCAVKAGLIEKAPYMDVKAEFGDIGSQQGYNNFYPFVPQSPTDKQDMKKYIQQLEALKNDGTSPPPL